MNRFAVHQWLEDPLRRFADDARLRGAVLLHPSGQVLGQYGFSNATDVTAACALAAASHASGGALAAQLGRDSFKALHHDGHDRQIFLSGVDAGRAKYLVLAVFDSGTSIGEVQLFFDDFSARLTHHASHTPSAIPMFAPDFEVALQDSMAKLFEPRVSFQDRGAHGNH